MAIKSSDLQWFYVGESGFIGGRITSGALHNVFSEISGARNRDLAVDYRVIALRNVSAQTLTSARIWFRYVDPRGAGVGIALDPIGAVTATSRLSGGVAPGTFSSPTTSGTGLAVASLAGGQAIGVWIRRNATASSGAFPERNIITVTGTTPA
jgi:hypothetical protein